jgi:hypothetical protein
MIRALVISVCLLVGPMAAGCVAFMYGGPGFSESREVTVPFDETVLAAVARTDDEITITLTNGRSLNIYQPFTFRGEVCGHYGCIPGERISSVTMSEEQLNLGYAATEVVARGQAALLAPLVLPLAMSARPGLRERMRSDPAAWLSEQWQPSSLRDRAHPVCRYDPEAPSFSGTTDAEAAEWVWENRYALHGSCFSAARPVTRMYLSENQQVELYHLEMLDEMWDRARCRRAAFHVFDVDGFSPVYDTRPAYAVIEFESLGADAAWRRFETLLASDTWVDEPGPFIERMCESFGGVADRAHWGERLSEVRRTSLAYRDDPVLFIDEQRIEPDGSCANEDQTVGACYRTLFNRGGEAQGAS